MSRKALTLEERIEFGTRLKSLIEISGFSQSKLAEELGTTRQTVYHYTTGEIYPSPARIQKIARILNISENDLYLTSTNTYIPIYYKYPFDNDPIDYVQYTSHVYNLDNAFGIRLINNNFSAFNFYKDDLLIFCPFDDSILYSPSTIFFMSDGSISHLKEKSFDAQPEAVLVSLIRDFV